MHKSELKERFRERASGIVDDDGVAKYFCSECKSYLFMVEDGKLIVKSRHFGESHVTIIPLELISRKAAIALPNGIVLEV